MLNKVILIGRLTKDPDIKVTNTGNPVGSFTLAVNRNYASANGEKEADFINCVCFRKLAEIVGQYVKKGSLISVEGRISTRTYDGQDGQKRYVTEVICDNVVFLDTRSSSQNESQYQNQYSNQQPTFNVNQQQQNRYNKPMNNQATNQNYSQQQPSDDYFNENVNIDISEDDLPF